MNMLSAKRVARTYTVRNSLLIFGLSLFACFALLTFSSWIILTCCTAMYVCLLLYFGRRMPRKHLLPILTRRLDAKAFQDVIASVYLASTRTWMHACAAVFTGQYALAVTLCDAKLRGKHTARTRCLYFSLLARVYFEQGDTQRLALVLNAWQPYAAKVPHAAANATLLFYRAFLSEDDATCLAICDAWEKAPDDKIWKVYRATLYRALLYARQQTTELARAFATRAAAMAPGMYAAEALARAYTEGDAASAKVLLANEPTLPSPALRDTYEAKRIGQHFATWLWRVLLLFFAYGCAYYAYSYLYYALYYVLINMYT